MDDSTPTFPTILHSTSRSLDALRDFVDVLDAFLNQKTQESMTQHVKGLAPLLVAVHKSGIYSKASLPQELIDEIGDVVEVGAPDERGRREIRFKRPPGPEFEEALRAVGKASARTRMLYGSALMNLTSAVELFFSRLLHLYFDLHPDAVGTKEKLFSIDDLAKFASIPEARKHYVLSKIEELLRGAFGEWIAYLRSYIKLSIGYLKDDQPLLEETFQRRNVVVHNGAIANSIYLSKVSAEYRVDIADGDDITPARSYLHDRIDLFETYCVLIAAELWKQLRSADEERATVLLDIAYEHLKAGRFTITRALSHFLVQDKQLSESARVVAQLNLWLCDKRLGEWDKSKKDAQEADFSAKCLRYQLGHAALVEDHDLFYELLPRALQADEISLDELRTFPIMEEVRVDERFAPYEETNASSDPPGDEPRVQRLASDSTGATLTAMDGGV